MFSSTNWTAITALPQHLRCEEVLLVPVPAAAVRFAEIALSAIDPNPRQPRQQFDPDALTELVASIRVVGILQPVVVRPSPDADDRFQPSWASVGGAPLGKPG